MAVSSRIFGVSINNVKTDCFAPFADMLNHRRPRQTEWYFSEKHNAFIIQAIEDIPAGEEVRKLKIRFSIAMDESVTQGFF